MERHELNDLVEKFNFPIEKLQILSDHYPSAKKDFVEQILFYVKNHGMTFSYAMNMMEMDAPFLQFLGINKAVRLSERKLHERSEA